MLDLGTGPGFPAWPLAAARPDLSVAALDSNGRMLEFLRSHPLPNLTVVEGRAEERVERERYDAVTGRAVAPLAAQVEISAAFLRRGGLLLPYRTPADDPAAVEAGPLGLRWRETVRRELPTGEARACPVFEKVAPTDRRYPRRWSEIKARPLVRESR